MKKQKLDLAAVLERQFHRQERNDKGFFTLSPISLAAESGPTPASVTVECPESWDSTELWEFADGSKARVANPRQGAFPGDVTAL